MARHPPPVTDHAAGQALMKNTAPRFACNALLLRKAYSGVENMLHDFLWAWAEYGGEPLRVYAPERTPLPLPQAGALEVCRVPLAGRFRPSRIVAEHLWLPRRLRHERIKLLHAPAYIAPQAAPCPVVLTVHDLHVFTHPQCCRLENRLYYRLFLPGSVRRAAGIVVYSEHVRRVVAERFPQAAGKIAVAPPGVDRRFTPLVEAAAHQRVRRKYGLPPRYLLFVGDIAPRKNLPRLLQALRLVGSTASGDLHLLLAGHAQRPQQAALRSEIARLGLGRLVSFAGYVPRADLPALYAGAQALAFPSLDEGFGLPVLEAMACGCPVVSGPGGMAEMCAGAVIGCDPLDAASIAAALRRATAGEPRQRAIAGGLACAQRFSWRAHVAAMGEIYRAAAADGPVA